MKVLTLIIKQKWFDEIIKGNKKQEFRELRPASEKKYIEYQKDGTFDAIKFDAIRFYVGYNKNRDTALVEEGVSKVQNYPLYKSNSQLE